MQFPAWQLLVFKAISMRFEDSKDRTLDRNDCIHKTVVINNQFHYFSTVYFKKYPAECRTRSLVLCVCVCVCVCVCIHHRVQNGSGAHPASYPMGTRGFFPGGEAVGE
jgi:hypothetical protein